MSVVGFDFGNESCVVSVARRQRIDVLQNEMGLRRTPCLVAFSGKQRFVGDKAVAQWSSNFKNTVSQVKRFIGRDMDTFEMPYEGQFLAFALAKDSRGRVGVQVSYDDKKEVFSAEQIAGTMFAKLKQIAEHGSDGAKVVDCVVSCPAHWADQQRRALLDAANIAGLNVLRLINEPTAIALNYGFTKKFPENAKPIKVLFIDMGHSNTTVALAELTHDTLKMVASEVDSHLGGRDFDQLLVTHYTQLIKTKYSMDVSVDPKAMMKLRNECNRVKKVLSANIVAQFAVEYIMNDRDVTAMTERAEFETMLEGVMPRVYTLVESVLASTGTTKEELASVEIVGGSMRIPAVQHGLTKYFGREMSKTCDSDESIARGCALMCAMLSPSVQTRKYEVIDMFNYAVEVGGDDMMHGDETTVFQPRNPIPSIKMVSFDNRTEAFQLAPRYKDASKLPVGTNPVIGHFVVSGMPPKKHDMPVPRIKVRVKLDVNGIVSVPTAQLIEEIKEEAAPQPAHDAKHDHKHDAKHDCKHDCKEAHAADAKPADPAAAAAAPEVPKKKVKKTDLKVESHTQSLDHATLTAYLEREVAMGSQDRILAETAEARNTVEAYILEERGKYEEGGELAAYIKSEDRVKLLSMFMEGEDWLYNDGADAQKSEYKMKLDELKALGDAAENRKHEEQYRPEGVQALKSLIGYYQTAVAAAGDALAHLEQKDKLTIAQEAQKAEAWLMEQLARQEALPQHADPVLTMDALKQQVTHLTGVCQPILNKPKPAPKKEEPAKPEAHAQPDASAAGASSNGTGPADAEMDTSK